MQAFPSAWMNVPARVLVRTLYPVTPPVSGDEVVACLLAHRLDITWVDPFAGRSSLGRSPPGRIGAGGRSQGTHRAGFARACPGLDFFFLFAHSSVADFYPRIGFTQMAQSRLPSYKNRCHWQIQTGLAGWPRATLDRVEALAGARTSFIHRGAKSGDRHLLLFHCLESFPEHIFHLGDCLVIAKLAGNRTLHLIDVIARI